MAFFIPHQGCPHQCSFCNQKSITGVAQKVTGKQVAAVLKQAEKELEGKKEGSEIAFFGGSFTAVPIPYQEELLQAAYPFVVNGSFSGIRISTRPDAIDDEILKRLKRYGVTCIELGAQSMDDQVLAVNQRGHTAEEVVQASWLIRQHGFSLGLQMMTGLYGSSPDSDWSTAEKIALCKPDCVRIYPTVVLKGTKLAEYFEKGAYLPPDAEQSVPLCAKLLRLFEQKGIPVIRLGLHDTADLKRDLLAGAYHPALREKCQSYLFYQDILARVAAIEENPSAIIILGNPKDISQIIGQKRENIEKLKRRGIDAMVTAESSLPSGEIRVKCR